MNVFSGKLFKNPFILVINCNEDQESGLNSIIGRYSPSYRLKSRNFTKKGVDYVYELSLKDPQSLSKEISESKLAEQFSLLEYDGNDII